MTKTALNDPKIIVALDCASRASAEAMADTLDPGLCRVKVGKELFTREGPQVVRTLVDRGYDVFLDLKFHDIPNTTANACLAAADLGVWMLNVHASGGRRMMEAARNALDKAGHTSLLIGVTVLTSMEQTDLQAVGINQPPEEQVLRLARLARGSGLDGVVCSAQEAQLLKAAIDGPFTLVTPGIRLTNKTNDDQRRVMTPLRAMQSGADYLVIGRPVTQANNPRWQLADINESLRAYLAGQVSP